jgi:uncharacterized membrane protein
MSTMPVVSDWGVAARAIHVVAVVVWIGGVWMVTTVFMPQLRDRLPAEWLDEFEAIEARFAPQGRVATLLVGLSGFYMLYQYDLWDRFLSGAFWWMHLMVAVWLIFTAVLFLGEPLLLRRWIHKQGRAAPRATLDLMLWLHRVLLGASLLAILCAVAGSHGWF